MDFSLPPEIDQLRGRIRAFVNDRLIPLEADRASYDAHESIDTGLLQTLRAEARAQGLWALNMPKQRGGGGLKLTALAACYEEMNRSIFGPVVFHGAAPDDGNMRVLNQVATEAQKTRWLQPIIDGAVQSAFVMTEPMDEDGAGCGSDPSLTYTTATRTNAGWVVKGRKWFITGAGAAQHFILIARTSDDPRRGLSAFLFHADQPGWRIVRRIPIMGPEEHGGHCELEFDGLEIPEENLLMQEGDGLKLTQIRLGPARLTHCMRWLGLARRSLEVAMAYVEKRRSFGGRLIDKESVQGQIGQAAMEIQIGRLLTMNAAWKLDQGDFARKEVSMAKVVVADALHKAADTALQLLGGRGYSKDTPVEWIYRYARQARLVDGASEVHRMVLANFMRKEGTDFFKWGV
ncbi:acyl-CoA dehydrogenase family protein [Limobrevibacterium gyesilva]|uniref:Acyl-CoA dehydrogenase family protein n=1 Tax=Limobrevibacterium gyesilva TaxID=2991712 RepID=A0AA41YQ33_9PROT|nr:acyl-CoA dehydrogenase family protein [Limobrevibacterium gyesilva]MCW3474548.1 acyl-CoA dehydrogenase family protein [Limobrevibacterium gyesilva]